jgi:CHAD domain-containing protein
VAASGDPASTGSIWELTAAAREDSAARVVALVVEGYLRSFQAREPGVRAGDVEELHQFRVDLRRTRSVLRSFRGVLPEKRRRLAMAAMRDMAAPTSAVRDLDVLDETLDSLLGDVLSDDTLRIAGLVEARRRAARVEMIEALDGESMAQLVAVWRSVAEVYVIGGGDPPALAHRRMGPVADAALWDAYSRSRSAGKAATRSDDLEHWHDLRKALKGYRYLLEAFAPLWEGEDRKAVRRDLRKLQDHIGGLQDLRVQVATFQDLAAESDAVGWRSTADLAQSVARRLRDETERTRRGCRAAWSAFDTTETRDRMRVITGRAS